MPGDCKVVSLHWNDGGSIVEKDLLTGFLTPKGRVLDPPAELAQDEGGNLDISDDHADTLYRLYPIKQPN